MAKPPGKPREIKRAAEADAAIRTRAPKKLDPRQIGIFDDPMPPLVEPCLPTLVEKPPVDERWQHEIKWDGYRLLCHREGESVRLLTRRGHDWTNRFPAIRDSIAALPVRAAILDGEAVIEDERGMSSFQALQAALAAGAAYEAVHFAFDLLYLDGRDLRTAPLAERQAELAELLARSGNAPALRLSEHYTGNGSELYEHACRMGLEGIVSKRRDCPYRSGRVEQWVKTKCVTRDDFVVLGYLLSTAQRGALGALLLGTFRQGELIYAGRVGTGFTASAAADLLTRLKSLRADRAPVPGRFPRAYVWVRPELVAEVEHRGWTFDGLLRHPSYKGLRKDLEPGDVG